MTEDRFLTSEKDRFLNVLQTRTDSSQRDVAERIIRFLESCDLYELWYGDKQRDKSCIPRAKPEIEVFTVWSYGRIWIPIEAMKNQPFWREEANQQAVIRTFQSFVRLDWGTAKRPKKNPTIELRDLRESDIFEEFKNATTWLIGQIKAR